MIILGSLLLECMGFVDFLLFMLFSGMFLFGLFFVLFLFFVFVLLVDGDWESCEELWLWELEEVWVWVV